MPTYSNMTWDLLWREIPIYRAVMADLPIPSIFHAEFFPRKQALCVVDVNFTVLLDLRDSISLQETR